MWYNVRNCSEGRSEMYVCICEAITETKLQECIHENSCTKVSHVKKACHAGTQCGKCIPWIKKMLMTSSALRATSEKKE